MKKNLLLALFIVCAIVVGFILLNNTKEQSIVTEEATEQVKEAPAEQTPDKSGYIVKVGEMAPDFDINISDKENIKLSDLRGKVVMIQFTATWCGVCLKEMPHIQKDIWEKHKDNKDFALYGVMYKQGEKDAQIMADKTKVTYPLAIDPSGEFFHKYAAQGAGVTRNIIVDKDGKIAFMTRLFVEEEFEGMKAKIEELLAQ